MLTAIKARKIPNTLIIAIFINIPSLNTKFVFENVVVAENNLQSASSVGKIGYKKHKEKDLTSADTIMPMYLRKSQAERMKKEKGG